MGFEPIISIWIIIVFSDVTLQFTIVNKEYLAECEVLNFPALFQFNLLPIF